MNPRDRRERDKAKADQYIGRDGGAPTATGGYENVTLIRPDVVLDPPLMSPAEMQRLVAQLAKLGPLEFDQVCKEQASYLGVLPGTLRAEVKKARAAAGGKTKALPEPPLPVDIEKLEESAAPIIDSADVLGLFEKA